jgi:hypothetical protein
MILLRWSTAEVADDDRTVTLGYHANFDDDTFEPAVIAEFSAEVVSLALALDPV